jgi:hypothetical protein
MAMMGFPITSSLGMSAKVVIVNNGRMISPLRRACVAFRIGLVRRVEFSCAFVELNRSGIRRSNNTFLVGSRTYQTGH